MTILSIVQSACLYLDLEQPNTLYSNTNRTTLELGDVANRAADQILDDYDWQRLIKTATIVADSVTSAFPLPSDYSRMVKDANLWGPSFTFYPTQQVADFNQWLALLSYDIETWQPRWGVFGGNINVLPVMSTGNNLNYGYISKNIVNGADPTKFTADTDEFVLNDELLKLAIIWNWKQAKGYDFQAELAQYAEHLERLRFRDPGARQTIISGRNFRRFPTGQSFP